MPTPEYSPQSTTVLEVGVEGRGEHEGGGDEASPAAVSRCAGEQKRGESELCAPVEIWAPVGGQRSKRGRCVIGSGWFRQMCLLPGGVDRCAYDRGGGFDRCAYSRVVSTDVPTTAVVVSTDVPTPALTDVPTTEVLVSAGVPTPEWCRQMCLLPRWWFRQVCLLPR